MSAAIEFDGVTKIYRRSHLGRTVESVGLEEFSLSIHSGEVFGLLGLNGSGKTTAIRLLLGLLAPTRGVARVKGRKMPDMSALQKIGYLPEAAYVNRALTGREAVRVFASLSKVPRTSLNQRVETALNGVGLLGSADRRIFEYSKGMMQRVSMAQALVHDPDILVMDEPVTGLDPLAIKELREFILWLKSRGKTVLISSHNISEVEKVCDRVAILAAGRLVRSMEQNEWRQREGAMEDVFTTCVRRTEGIGPLRLSEVF